MAKRNINYTGKDFDTLKSDLKAFAKNYFPDAHKDFSDGSTMELLLEMCAYCGDILSFYQDEQFREIFSDTVTENILDLAYTFGAKPRGYASSLGNVKLEVLLPSTSAANRKPNYNYAPIIGEGSTFATSDGNNTIFRTVEPVNFAYTSSLSSITESVHQVDGSNLPTMWKITKYVGVISGEPKVDTLSIGYDVRNNIDVSLAEKNIIEIENVYDQNNERWYEVDYLAQSTIIDYVPNDISQGTQYFSDRQNVPYLIKFKRVDNKFVTRLDKDGYIHLIFGNGSQTQEDEEIVNNITDHGIPGQLLITNNESIDPNRFLDTKTLGVSPINKTLTVKYRVGKGVLDNAAANSINRKVDVSFVFRNQDTDLDDDIVDTVRDSLTVTNETPCFGGAGYPSAREIKENIKASFGAQNRMVNREDVVTRVLSMPGKFGRISKVYVETSHETADKTKRRIEFERNVRKTSPEKSKIPPQRLDSIGREEDRFFRKNITGEQT